MDAEGRDEGPDLVGERALQGIVFVGDGPERFETLERDFSLGRRNLGDVPFHISGDEYVPRAVVPHRCSPDMDR
ncbi:hypothetical protein D3C71_1764250 [compost metagenome]